MVASSSKIFSLYTITLLMFLVRRCVCLSYSICLRLLIVCFDLVDGVAGCFSVVIGLFEGNVCTPGKPQLPNSCDLISGHHLVKNWFSKSAVSVLLLICISCNGLTVGDLCCSVQLFSISAGINICWLYNKV